MPYSGLGVYLSENGKEVTMPVKWALEEGIGIQTLLHLQK